MNGTLKSSKNRVILEYQTEPTTLINLDYHIIGGHNQTVSLTHNPNTKQYWQSLISDKYLIKIFNKILLQDEITSIFNNIENLGYEGTGLIFEDELMINDNHLGVNDNNQLEIKNIPYEKLLIPSTDGYLNYKLTGWEVSDIIGDINVLIQHKSHHVINI